MDKILIIRLSSIGDIIQCMSVVGGIKNNQPDTQIHWIVRKDMASLLRIDPRIDKIREFNRKSGLAGLIKMGFALRKEHYRYVYDAHSNIRSTILKAIICPFGICNLFKKKIVTRHKSRFKRLLLFNFRINLFPSPFKAFESYRAPLKKLGITDFNIPFDGWKFSSETIKNFNTLVQSKLTADSKWITLVPSATWELKRWPVTYWQELITLLPDSHFVVLGGPEDHFCEDIKKAAPERVINLAGQTSLLDSFCVIYHSAYVISGDTGFLHAADLFGKPGQAIIGPTAFGFPSGDKMKVTEVNLSCRPCTKDGHSKCRIEEKKKCLLDITPQMIANTVGDF